MTSPHEQSTGGTECRERLVARRRRLSIRCVSARPRVRGRTCCRGQVLWGADSNLDGNPLVKSG